MIQIEIFGTFGTFLMGLRNLAVSPAPPPLLKYRFGHQFYNFWKKCIFRFPELWTIPPMENTSLAQSYSVLTKKYNEIFTFV